MVANIAKLSEAVVWDRRDDPINSRKGTFSSISFDQSASFLGSDHQNRKLLMQQFLFVPLGKLVLASRAQIGFAYGRDPLASFGSLPRRRRDERAGIRRGRSRRRVIRTACRSAAIAW